MEEIKGFHSGIYKDIPGRGHTAPIHERANLLRAVSKSLISAGIDRSRRRQIILELCSEFGVELSEHGIEHFLDE